MVAWGDVGGGGLVVGGTGGSRGWGTDIVLPAGLGCSPSWYPQPCSCCVVLFVTLCLSFPTAKGTVMLLGAIRAAC